MRYLFLLAGALACAAPSQTDNMGAPAPATAVGPNAPTNPAISAYVVPDEWTLAGDSIKYVIFWKQAADSATLGPVDSTFYRLTASKPVVFYPAVAVAANTAKRRSFPAGVFVDSLKIAKPAVGDSINFQITAFTQCRKGDCSVPGSAAWKYRSTWAPPATAPNIREQSF